MELGREEYRQRFLGDEYEYQYQRTDRDEGAQLDAELKETILKLFHLNMYLTLILKARNIFD